ncbi:LuxR C-terminal-related transcriptional regulator [Kineococcus sp. SYSU DK006]|uniref:LuxR C-terminal-related transcriptional regulator n=1 Tax=Kineococcus sp. SYSU DK006 TaxID=3383127 RepID=UPI003D7D44DC
MDATGAGHEAAGAACGHLRALARQAARQPLVLAVDGVRLVCLTEDAFTRLTGATGAAGAAGTPGGATPEAGPSRPAAVRLTPREREVLLLVATGRTAAGAATVLGVAVNTVSQHLVGVRRKYGVSSTRAAVERARADGELPPG